MTAWSARPTFARLWATLRITTLGTTTITSSAPATSAQSLVTFTFSGSGRAPLMGTRLMRVSRMVAASFSR